MAELKELVKLTNPLRTIKDSNVNQIGASSIKFLNTYKLEKGKAVKFRLLKKKNNTDPDKKEGKFIYPNTTLRTQYWIADNEAGPIEIAAIQSVNRDGSFRIKKYSVDGSSSQGLFVLYGDSVEDQMIFPFLMLSPENKTSPFYEPTQELYEVIDEISEAKKSVNRVGVLHKCLTFISNLELDELKLYNTAFGGNVTDEKEVMMARLNELAISNAEDFYKKVDEPVLKIKAIIKQATDLNIVQYDPQQHRYLWVGGQTIGTLDRVDGKEPIDLFAEWLDTSKDGEKLQRMIQLKIK